MSVARKRSTKGTGTTRRYRKKTERTKIKEELILLAKLIAKTRDRYKCQRCGSTPYNTSKIQGSHVIAVSQDLRLAFDPENIKAMCGQCHMWWHENVMDAYEWFAEQFPNRWKRIQLKRVGNRARGTVTMIELRDSLERLEKEWSETKNG